MLSFLFLPVAHKVFEQMQHRTLRIQFGLALRRIILHICISCPHFCKSCPLLVKPTLVSLSALSRPADSRINIGRFSSSRLSPHRRPRLVKPTHVSPPAPSCHNDSRPVLNLVSSD